MTRRLINNNVTPLLWKWNHERHFIPGLLRKWCAIIRLMLGSQLSNMVLDAEKNTHLESKCSITAKTEHYLQEPIAAATRRKHNQWLLQWWSPLPTLTARCSSLPCPMLSLGHMRAKPNQQLKWNSMSVRMVEDIVEKDRWLFVYCLVRTGDISREFDFEVFVFQAATSCPPLIWFARIGSSRSPRIDPTI
jgi:hypothetical protein